MKKIMKCMLALGLALGLQTSAWAFEGEKEMPQANLMGVVAQADMDQELQGDNLEKVYLRYSEEEVVVFQKLGKDNAACSQILCAAPMDKIIEVYTNDKKSFKKMYSVIRSRMPYEDGNAGFSVVADKSPVNKLSKDKAIYRFWFKKTKTVNIINQHRGGYGLPIGIGIGIGIGHGRHHHGGIVLPPPRPHRPHGGRPGR